MRLLFIIGFVALSFKSLNAHSKETSEKPDNDTLDSKLQETLGRLAKISDQERVNAVTEITNCANNFALNLYKNFSITTKHNYVIAGYSTFKAMGMAAWGAERDTKIQIRNVLQLPINKRKIFAGFEEIQRTLKDIPDSILRLDTDLWHSYSTNLKFSYKYILERIYDAAYQPFYFLGPNRKIKIYHEARFTCNLIGEKGKVYEGKKMLEVIKPTGNYKYGHLSEINAAFIEIPCTDQPHDFYQIEYNEIQMNGQMQPTKSNTRAVRMFLLFPKDSFEELENNIEKMSVKKLLGGESSELEKWLPLIRTNNYTDIKEQLVRMGLTKMFSEKDRFHDIAEGVELDGSINDATLNIVKITDLWSVLPIDHEIPIEKVITGPFISVVTTTGENPLILQMGRHISYLDKSDSL